MPFALSQGLNPLLTNWVDYPAGANLMWNTTVPLPALLLSPVTLAAGPVLAYNVAVTGGIALTAWSGELAAAAFVRRRWTAVVAGLLTGFSPYMAAQALGHLHLVIAFLPGVALYLLHDLLVARRHRAIAAGAMLGAAAAAQLLTGEEIVASTALVSVLGIALWLLGRGRPEWPRALPGLAAAAAVFVLLAGLPLAVQLLGPQRTVHAIPGQIQGNDLAGFIAPLPLQALRPYSIPLAGPFLSEQNAYLGVPLLIVLAAIAWRLRRMGAVRWAALLALGLAVLALGPHLYVAGRRLPGVLPWRALTPLPVVNDMLPNRLMLYVFLLAGVLLAVALDRAGAARRGLPVAIAAALALVPLVPTFDFPVTRFSTPAYLLTGIREAVPEGAVVLVTPLAQPDTMFWQAEAGFWFRMPQGYIRVPGCGGVDALFTPPSATSAALAAGGPPTPSQVAAVRAELAYWRVREVVVGPGSPAGAGRVFAAVTGDTGRVAGGVLVFDLPATPAPATRPPTLCQT